ncbi:MAG: serine hydrolase [Rhizomicrobium sp.]
MPKILAGLVLSGLTLFAAGAAAAGVLPARVDDAVKARIAAGQYPALVIAYVDHGRTQVAAYGTLGGGKAPDGDTVFEIGSITKTFTATILADAVTRGTLGLDAKVATLLPDFTIPTRGGKAITLADIATQHSGLPRLPDNFNPADPKNPYADYGAAQLKAFLASYALPRDPGASYEYSNLAFGLLGYALAQNAHADYRTLLRQVVLGPLGMRDTDTETSAAQAARMAPGHDMRGEPQPNWDLSALAGAGAIRSTGNDMLRYLRANMGEASPLSAAMTLAHAARTDGPPGERIGLAWMTRTTGAGPVVWHNGMTGGYAGVIAFTADGTRGIVVLTNMAVEVEDLAFAALDPSAPLAPAQKSITLAPAELEQYTGRYQLEPNFVLNVAPRDGQLFAQATGQGPFPLYPTARNEFVARVGGISVSFTRDAQGRVAGLVLHQNGDRIAPRLPDPPVVTLDAATLAGYVGRYQFAPGRVFDVTVRDGGLFVQLTGQPALPVFPAARDKFFYKVVDATIDFERDASGAVVAQILHQNGRDVRAPRLAP